MPKNRTVIVLGLLVALQPILGFPRSWEFYFQIIIGLLIVFFSVWATIDKHLTLKAKAQKKQAHRQKERELEAIKQVEDQSFQQEGEF